MAMLVAGMPDWITFASGAVGAVAAVTDYRTGKIYNWLTLPALVAGLCVAAFIGKAALVASLAGLGTAALIFVPLFALGILGAGDVKLVMALGTVLGARGTLELTFFCIVIAAVGSVALLIKHGRVRIFFEQVFIFFRSMVVKGLVVQWPKLSREIKAPFGIPIFLGLLVVLAS